uniref:Uncharacterized protein n=1 Tax=Siphoviridae sp. ct9mC1 TaxID=2827794 RepID=A0A8S5SFV9_9CAUD|nr:MAG TPA: hypothetical protein [Siphoviridae sp. ct9mC1]
MNERGYFHPYSSVETVEVFFVNISICVPEGSDLV